MLFDVYKQEQSSIGKDCERNQKHELNGPGFMNLVCAPGQPERLPCREIDVPPKSIVTRLDSGVFIRTGQYFFQDLHDRRCKQELTSTSRRQPFPK
jgi:hypothetical protein